MKTNHHTFAEHGERERASLLNCDSTCVHIERMHEVMLYRAHILMCLCVCVCMHTCASVWIYDNQVFTWWTCVGYRIHVLKSFDIHAGYVRMFEHFLMNVKSGMWFKLVHGPFGTESTSKTTLITMVVIISARANIHPTDCTRRAAILSYNSQRAL